MLSGLSVAFSCQRSSTNEGASYLGPVLCITVVAPSDWTGGGLQHCLSIHIAMCIVLIHSNHFSCANPPLGAEGLELFCLYNPGKFSQLASKCIFIQLLNLLDFAHF